MSLATTERAALADLFAQVGPDRPTLCEGWNTGDLLAHLLLRERRPDAATGIMLRPLAGWTDKVAAGYREQPWESQVALYRNGPPMWNPMGWGPLNDLANAGEMFVHHEDVRRGEPGWQPRAFTKEETAELAGLLRSPMLRQQLRRAGAGVSAEFPDTFQPKGGGPQLILRPGQPHATVRGAVPEVVLWGFGRREVQVEVTGDDAALAALRDAGLAVPDS